MKFKDFVSSPIYRTNIVGRYSGTDCSRPENLSEHITDVMIMAYQIALIGQEKYNEDLDIGELLEKVLVHDLDEVMTGDIPRGTKYYSTETLTSMKELAKSCMRYICRDHLKSERPYQMWLNSKDGKEGWILKIVDLLCVAKKAMIEIELLGNLQFLKVARECSGYLIHLPLNEIPVGDEFKSYLSSLVSDAFTELESVLDKHQYEIDKYQLSTMMDLKRTR